MFQTYKQNYDAAQQTKNISLINSLLKFLEDCQLDTSFPERDLIDNFFKETGFQTEKKNENASNEAGHNSPIESTTSQPNNVCKSADGAKKNLLKVANPIDQDIPKLMRRVELLESNLSKLEEKYHTLENKTNSAILQADSFSQTIMNRLKSVENERVNLANKCQELAAKINALEEQRSKGEKNNDFW